MKKWNQLSAKGIGISALVLSLALGVLVSVSASEVRPYDQAPTDQTLSKREQKEQRKEQERAASMQLFMAAKEAIAAQKFVLEVERVQPTGGKLIYVNKDVNFVSMDGDRGVVQLSFNNAMAGSNGMGGITLAGNVANWKVSEDKRGNVGAQFMLTGVQVDNSSVFITLTQGTNYAKAVIDNRISVTGRLLPTDQASVVKGTEFQNIPRGLR